ncbi:guanylate kinase, partial [Metarhizium hybridum]
MEGVKQMKADHGIDARYIFIKPPRFEEVEMRLRRPGTENEEDIKKRLVQARPRLSTPPRRAFIILS